MPDARWNDPREYDDRDPGDGRPRVYAERDRDDHDPRDSLMHDVDLPRGEERELVVDRHRVYELNGDDSRTLAAVGTFRVVPEQDLDTNRDTVRHLRDEGLVETVELGGTERGLTLTKEGRELLDSHTLERGGAAPQAFHAGVSRPREIEHDANLYATFCQEEARLRDEHPDLEIRPSSSSRTSSGSTRNSCRDTTEAEQTPTAEQEYIGVVTSVPHGTSSVRPKGQRSAHPAGAHRARHRAHSPHFAAVGPARS